MKTAAGVMSEARCALKPPPRLKLSEWADQKYYLSAESAAEPGRWTTLPYQRAWMDAFTDPRIEEVSIIKSARVGFTKVLNAVIGYHVDHDPCAILLVQPTEDDAKGYAKEEIEPMIRDCAAIGEKFGATAGKVDTMLHKRFRGGLLQLAGARSPGNFRRVSRRVVLGDEVDGYPLSAGREGDPIALAKRRAEHFWNRKYGWGSTPTIAGVSRIAQLFYQGDQRRYYVPCPHCGFFQVLQFPQLKWPDGEPAHAYFQCLSCQKAIDHEHKRAMIEAGEWRPGPHAQFPHDPAPAPFHGHASFHLWAAYSFSPNASWGQLASEFVAATAGGREHLKTFVNTVLGETWEDRGEAPEWRRLYDRREDYAIGTCPAGVLFLTCGVDVQHDRIVWEVVGWGREKESWSIDAGVIPGDTSNLTRKGPWPQLDALIERQFPHALGTELRIRMLAVDSGDQTQVVYNWARKKEAARVMVVKGVDSADVLVSSGSKVDVSVNGKRVGRLRLYLVGKTIAVNEFYGWLKLELPTDEERAEGADTPPGYPHFPRYGEQFFKELTALQLVSDTNSRGFTVRSWERIPGRSDDFLAARRYARAAACFVGLDRCGEDQWQALEQAVGSAQAPAVGTTASDPAKPAGATPKPQGRAPGRPAQAAWLPPRRGSWLRQRR